MDITTEAKNTILDRLVEIGMGMTNLSFSKALTMEFVKSHPDWEWDMYGLSLNLFESDVDMETLRLAKEHMASYKLFDWYRRVTKLDPSFKRAYEYIKRNLETMMGEEYVKERSRNMDNNITCTLSEGGILINEEHYDRFKDGLIGDLIDELDEGKGNILIPTEELNDSESEDLSIAIGIIAGTYDVTEYMTDDREFVLRMLSISRYMQSRQLLRVMMDNESFRTTRDTNWISDMYKHHALIFWFIISYLDDDMWDELTSVKSTLEYLDGYGNIVSTIIGFNFDIPVSEETFLALFDGENTWEMHDYIRDVYGKDVTNKLYEDVPHDYMDYINNMWY